MTHEDFLTYLMKMGFERQRAAGIVSSLLKRYTGKGFSEHAALHAISKDIEAQGEIYRELKAEIDGAPIAASAEVTKKSCPKCGYLRTPGEIQCSRCGVYFHKIKSAHKETRQPDSPPPMKSVHAQSNGNVLRGAKYKWLIAVAVVFAVLFMVATIIQSHYKSEFGKKLETFDDRFSMNSQAAFEQTLDDMKIVIEEAAILVSKRAWRESDIDRFLKETDKRYSRFIEGMHDAEEDQNVLFGHNVENIQRQLCGGMRMVVDNIRNKKMKAIGSFGVAAGRYACDTNQYRASSNRVLVRHGNSFVLRAKTGGEISREKTVREGMERDRAFAKAVREISSMQHSYRRKHDAFCGDIMQLIDEESGSPPLSLTTLDLVRDGMINVKLTDGGKMYAVIDHQGNAYH